MTDSILARAAQAVVRGPRQLGTLTNTALREADIWYNSDDGYYYVISTEADGNPPPVDPDTGTNYTFSVQSSVNNGDGSTTVTLTAPHNLTTCGQKYALVFSGVVGATGLAGSKICTCPSTTTLRVPNASTGTATSGTVTRSVSLSACGIRRATTPEGIVSATNGYTNNTDYMSFVASSLWYPTLLVEGSGGSAVWHLFGYTSGPVTRHRTYTGTRPAQQNIFTAGANINVTLGDISVRKNPTDGAWYAVGTTSDTTVAMYKNTDITNDSGWTLVAADVWAGAPPSWATGNKPDPNISFVDGQAYLLFTAAESGHSGEWNTGIATISTTTGLADAASAVRLQTYGAYASWQGGRVLSDMVLLRCHDNVDRIFGFCNAAFDVEGDVAWGCFDLGPFQGGVRVWDRAVGKAKAWDSVVGSAKIWDRGY